MSGPARPAAPTIGNTIEAPAQEAVSEQFEAINTQEDVMLEVPAAPAESLAQIPHYAPHVRPHLPRFKSMKVRQTVVPILLVVGFMFILGGVTKFIVGEDSPMRDPESYPGWVTPVMFALGAVFLAVGILNMFQIRNALRSQVQGADGV